MGDRVRHRPTDQLLDEAVRLLFDLHDPFPDERTQRLQMRRWLLLIRELGRRSDLDVAAAVHAERCQCEECWADKGYDPLLDRP